MSRHVVPGLVVLAIIGLTLRAALQSTIGLDYWWDAEPAIDALARGDLAAYAAESPAMGPFSIALRAPFVALIYDAREEARFLLGAVPCVLAVGLLAVWLKRLLIERGRPEATTLIACALLLVNPLTFQALHWGHPEELLGGALCVGAVILASRGRLGLAGLALGLALATKQWAVIAVLPTLLACPSGRWRVASTAFAIGIAFIVPQALADPAAFFGTAREAAFIGGGTDGTAVSPANVWWPFSEEHPKRPGSGYLFAVGSWVGQVAHAGIVLIGAPLALLLLRRRRVPFDALALLALAFLLRAVLDPFNIDYYHLPFLLALIAHEALVRRGLPWRSLIVALALGVTFQPGVDSMYQLSQQATLVGSLYLAWALPLLALLAAELYAPERAERLLAGVSARLRHLAPDSRSGASNFPS